MIAQSTGLIIGGLLPALFFGLSGVLAKPATQAGISTGFYLTILGLAAASVGLVFCSFCPRKPSRCAQGALQHLLG